MWYFLDSGSEGGYISLDVVRDLTCLVLEISDNFLVNNVIDDAVAFGDAN